MDTSKSVDAVANALQDMIEAQRRSYEAAAEGIVESQKRGVRYAQSSAQSFGNSFDGSHGSGGEAGGYNYQVVHAAYNPVRLWLRWVDLFQSQYSSVSDYLREQGEHNQRIHGEFAGSARAGQQSLRKIGEEWVSLYREMAAGASSYAGEGVQNVEEASRQGLAAVQETADQGVEANGSLPIANYDELSVSDVSKRLSNFSRQDLEKVRSYERLNRDRSSLVSELDRKIKAAS